MSNPGIPWDDLERAIRRDPGGRGVSSYHLDGQPLGNGQLAAASVELAANARSVAIVTGFCAFDGLRWVAETDGPPGALFLARALQEMGIDVALVTDAYGLPVLEVGCDHWRLPRQMVHCVPFEADDESAPARRTNDAADNARTDAWVQSFLDGGAGRRLTHLVSIERPGPSHTWETLQTQPRQGAAPVELFEREVPVDSRNLCHNMRGASINAQTAKTHRLFEMIAQQRRPIVTLGLADGGNEIGMGSFPWEVLRDAVAQGPGGKIACRIATDLTLLSGVSNWSAYALALAVCSLRGRMDLSATWDADHQRNLIETLVRNSPVVDGVTKRHEATVDGLSLDEYLQPLSEIRERLMA
jgi:hypothetical protein